MNILMLADESDNTDDDSCEDKEMNKTDNT